MGKKRRLINKSGKFISKHSNHPVLKHINSQTQPNESEVAEVVNKPIVEVKKVEKPIKFEETKVQFKPEPIVKTQSKTTTKVKKTVTKKITPKVKAGNKTTKRVKKTKPSDD